MLKRCEEKMLLQQARTVYWKKWAAKHEYEELKEGIRLEPALALLRKKTTEEWTEKHRNVAGNLVLEGGWVQKKLFDIGWSDESGCQACHKERRYRKAQALTLRCWHEITREIPEASRKCEQQARTSKKEWKWQRGIVTHPLRESQWNRGHLSVNMWESEKHKSLSMPGQDFKGHVATDGSLLGTGGKWSNWIMMKNWGPCMKCLARWRQNLRSSAPARGGADSIPVPSQESNWTHRGACRQKGNHIWAMERRK